MRWEREAVDRLSALDAADEQTTTLLRERQADVLAEAEATRALQELVEAGLLPARLATPPA